MKKKWGGDLLLACGVLLIAAVLYVLFRPGQAGAWAVVAVDGEQTARYPLNQDITVQIGEQDFNILEISNGAAAIIDANCGDHTCVHTGAIQRDGETIVCLPHRLIVRIEGGEAAEVDGIAQ